MKRAPPLTPWMLAALLIALLACKSNDQHCVSAIQYNGVRYASVGTANTKITAQENAQVGACMAYCEWGDATLDRAYQAWKSTPKGAATKTNRGFNIQLYLKPEKAACESHCNAALKNGTAQSKMECR